MNSIDPSLPSDEPSDEASNHADAMRLLWDKARDLAEPLREVFRELREAEASWPRSQHNYLYSPYIYPEEWLDMIDDLMTANFRGCWDDDAAAWDKQALDSAQQLADELRGGK